jgi:type I restriction enzyme, R subunit
MPNFISEDAIEKALLQKLKGEFGYEILNCHTAEADNLDDRSGRKIKGEVILADRLKEAGLRLNPHLPESAVEEAVERLRDRRYAMSAVAANQEIHGLFRDGVPVEFEDAGGRKEKDRVRFIDFQNPGNNRFLAVTQLWIKGERGHRRPDVLLYVNGLPLVFIELKNSNIKLKTAYEDNLTNYKVEIPQLFLANAFCVLSNAVETKVGGITSQWEHFFVWLRPEDEKEKVNLEQVRSEGTSLERLASGLFAPAALLEYVENFIVFYKDKQKIVAQNHQFIGVNKAFQLFQRRQDVQGKLGVFWHTQGSGKSFSMIFYTRKIMRKLTGNFTFVVVTDREDLDRQIYKNFLHTATVTEKDSAQPKDGAELRKFLGQNKRLVFTLIQKFRYDKGKAYPLLSDRDDIIVIVDEAHRTQYKSLAENMRAGLPKAQYLAFTGTPLLGRERKTNAWFGDYISEYNFQQSMDEGATVPLFYEKRVPEVLIQNEDLGEEFYEILEDENLDDAQQAKLERQFASEMEVIKRDDRLEKIAADIVFHFPRRGYLGKGMVITVDKFTAVKMHDKVQRLWKEELKQLQGRIAKSSSEIEKARMKKIVEFMRLVEMAVIISEEAGEEEKFNRLGLNIKPHRDRMNRLDEHGHDVEYNFKDEEHPLQLVFVCAMWLTGFDAPTVSTLYMDKPMKDHTLMQTIARANRVTSWQIRGVAKKNGEIVDYYNVFRNMKKALKDYARGEEGSEKPPLQEKSVLFQLLDEAIAQGKAFCQEKGIDMDALLAEPEVFKNISLFKSHADTLLGKDDWRKAFAVHENTITALYEAGKPEILGRPVVRFVAAFQYLRGIIDSIIEQKDLEAAGHRIAQLMDESLVVDSSKGFPLREPTPDLEIIPRGKVWDLSKLDFCKLEEEFKQSPYKNIEIADLKAFIDHKLDQMLKRNQTRIGFLQKLLAIVDAYNAGGSTNENYFQDLMRFAQDLRDEDERHIREGLSEDELELFDLIRKDKMTQEEVQKVRLASQSLLHRLLEESPKVLVQDWYKDTQTRNVVRSAVEEVLNAHLPESYDRILFKEKCDSVFDMMLDYAGQGRKWVA